MVNHDGNSLTNRSWLGYRLGIFRKNLRFISKIIPPLVSAFIECLQTMPRTRKSHNRERTREMLQRQLTGLTDPLPEDELALHLYTILCHKYRMRDRLEQQFLKKKQATPGSPIYCEFERRIVKTVKTISELTASEVVLRQEVDLVAIRRRLF